MALSDAYATAVEYRTLTDMSDTTKDADILKDITAVSRYVEFKLDRFFNKESEDSIRTYLVAENTDALWIDDLSATPTLIKVDTDEDGVYEETIIDYELLPFNATLEPEPKPYMQIRLVPWGDKTVFYKGERVQVTGKYGWPSVPEAVKRAVMHMTAILRLESPRATRRIPELGDTIEASSEGQAIVRQLLDKYKKGRYM